MAFGPVLLEFVIDAVNDSSLVATLVSPHAVAANEGIVLVFAQGQSRTVSSVTDSASPPNTYTRRAGGVGSTGNIEIWDCLTNNALPSGGTITLTLSGTDTLKRVGVYTLGGLANTTNIVTDTAGGTSFQGSTGTLTSLPVGTACFAGIGFAAGSLSGTEPSGWTIDNHNTATREIVIGHMTVATAGPVSFDVSINSSRAWRAGFAAYQSASAAAYTLTAAKGTFTETGVAAALKLGHVAAAGTGAFTKTGKDAALKVGHKTTADVSSFALTGKAVNLLKAVASTGFVCDGDSITNGTGTAPNYPAKLGSITSLPFIDRGISGQTLVNMDSGYATNVAPYYNGSTTNTLIILGGTNDLINSASASTLSSAIRSYCAKAKATGYKVLVGTVLPSQAISGANETSRQTYNADLRSNWGSFADGLVDFASVTELLDPSVTTYFRDGTHPTAAGYAAMAERARVDSVAASNPDHKNYDLINGLGFFDSTLSDNWYTAGSASSTIVSGELQVTAPGTNVNGRQEIYLGGMYGEPVAGKTYTVKAKMRVGTAASCRLDVVNGDTFDLLASSGSITSSTMVPVSFNVVWPSASAGLVQAITIEPAGGTFYIDELEIREATASTTLTADVGSFTETRVDASTLYGRVVLATPGAFTETGVDAGLSASRKLAVDPAALTLTGKDVLANQSRTAGTGSLTLTGQNATLTSARKLAVDAAAFTLTGIDAGFIAGRSLAAGASSLTLAGQAATAKADRVLAVDAAAFTLTGIDAAAVVTIDPAAGSFALTGQDASLYYGRTASASTGSFAVTGISAGSSSTYQLTAATGSFALAGKSVAFNNQAILSLSVGDFSEAGQDAGLAVARRIAADTGPLSFTGKDAALSAGRLTSAGVGSFAETGVAASLRYNHVSPAGIGAFTETGVAASLKLGHRLAAGVSAFTLTGIDAGPDASFANVVLLAGFNGADNATSFTEESSSHVAATFSGTAKLVQSGALFGSASARPATSGLGRIQFNEPSADFYKLKSAAGSLFTIELAVKFDSVTAPTTAQYIVSAGVWSSTTSVTNFDTRSWAILHRNNAGSNLVFSFSTDGVNTTNRVIVADTTTLTAGVWYRIAIDFDGTNARTYINGVMGAKGTMGLPFYRTGSPIVVGLYDQGGSTANFQGYVDELRITKGVARYASDSGYAVGTSAFPRFGIGHALTAAKGTYTETGVAASLKRGLRLAAGIGAFSETGVPVGVAAGRLLSAAKGAFTETGTAAGLAAARTTAASTGSYSVSGVSIGALDGHALTAAPASFTYTGVSASLVKTTVGHYTLATDPGTYSETGVAASLLYGRAVPASAGSYAETGVSSSLSRGLVVPAAPGSFAYTGVSSSALRGYRLLSAADSFSETGADAQLKASRYAPVDPGAYAVTGVPAQSASSKTLSVGPGSFAVTGYDAQSASSKSVSAGRGAFAATGAAATLLVARSTAAGTGSYAVTGVGLNELLTASRGQYAVTGQAASTRTDRRLSAASGSFALTGVPAGGAGQKVIPAQRGDVAVTGADAGTVAARTLRCQAGSYAETGKPATLQATRHIAADPTAYAETGKDARATVTRRMPAAAGSFAEGGVASGLMADRRIAANPRALTFTGRNVNLRQSTLSTLDPGELLFTGQDVEMILVKKITAGTGSTAVSGTITLTANRRQRGTPQLLF